MVRSTLYRVKLSMSREALYCTEGPSMVRSKLYRLNLSMSGGALYCTGESLYNEIQAVQAELIHVWRGLVLYRGVPVE